MIGASASFFCFLNRRLHLFCSAFSFLFFRSWKELSFSLYPQEQTKRCPSALPTSSIFFVTHGAAGVGQSGDCLAVSACSVLADEHASMFSIDQQHIFPTFWTLGPCQVVMPEGTGSCPDILYESLRISLDLVHEMSVRFFCLLRWTADAVPIER